MPSIAFFLKAALVAFVWSWCQVAYGQVTDATCLQDYSWAKNNKGQSPCIVAAYLQGTCYNGGEWFVAKLSAGQMYLPPTGEQANGCQCNTVTYNMLSACAACQGRGYASWNAWTAYCPAGIVRNGSYPFTIPNATAVPAWGFVDSSQSGNFNVELALTLSGGRDSTTPTTPNPPSQSMQPGVIVAICIGGLACLLCIGLGWLYYRRTRYTKQLMSNSSDSIRFSALFNPGNQLSPNYNQLEVEGPPTSPLFQWIKRVSSKPPEASFTIDRDSMFGSPISPVAESRPGRLRTLFTSSNHRSAPPRTRLVPPINANSQLANVSVTRDFTFVSSVGPPPLATNAEHRNRYTEPFGEPPRRPPQPIPSPPPIALPSTSRSKAYDFPEDEETQALTSPDRETLYPWDSVSNIDGEDDGAEVRYSDDQRLSVISERSPLTPPQRSRLVPVPLDSPEILYPLGVRPSGYPRSHGHQ